MAPSLRRFAPGFLGGVADRVLGGRAPMPRQQGGEVGRALPDSKGAEEPKDLQRSRAETNIIFTTTIGASQLIYSADQWVRIKVELQTAGPVVVGFRSEIVPVLSGKGRLLTNGVEWECYIPKGTRLYYAASSVNRIAFTIEPVPWMEQIAMQLRQVAGVFLAVGGKIVGAVKGEPEMPDPVPQTGMASSKPLQRLRPMIRPGRPL